MHGMADCTLVPWSRVLFDRRRAVGVEGLDRLEAPRLTLLSFGFVPHNRLPVGRQHQSRTGVVELDAIAAGLVDIEEERLLDRVLMWTGLDVDAVLETDVRGTQDLVLRIHGPRGVMEAAVRAVMVVREGDVVGLVVARHPNAGH